jgi:hypothetical protein
MTSPSGWRTFTFREGWLRKLGFSMKAEQAASLLARTPHFGDLDESEILELGACARRRTYRKGDYIFHQGDTGDALSS